MNTWCNTLWCNALWCNTWCNALWCNALWCNTLWCNTLWCNMLWCNTLWCNTLCRCDATRCDATRYAVVMQHPVMPLWCLPLCRRPGVQTVNISVQRISKLCLSNCQLNAVFGLHFILDDAVFQSKFSSVVSVTCSISLKKLPNILCDESICVSAHYFHADHLHKTLHPKLTYEVCLL